MANSTAQWIRRGINDWKARRGRRRVLVLEDLAAAYVPVPKVASSSLRLLVCQRQAAILHPGLVETMSQRALQKKLEAEIRRSLNAGELLRLCRTHYVFSFVRNPLTRLYSCYRDKVVKAAEQGKPFSLAPYGVEPDMSFEQFVECIADIPDDRAEQHFRSQHCFLRHEDRWLVHYVGRFEQLERDWETLASRLGLDSRPAARRSSGAGSGLEGLPLSAGMARVAAGRYREDIRLLGYQREVDAWLDGLG